MEQGAAGTQTVAQNQGAGSMTNDDRDKAIQETHDAVIPLTLMVEAHNKSLYGNGRKGIMDRVTRIESIACICTFGGFAIIVATYLWK